MTPTTPREALEKGLCVKHFDASHGPNAPPTHTTPVHTATIDAILTALAPFMKTPGTVEVCKLCSVDVTKLSDDYKKGCRGNIKSDNYSTNCPIKQVTNEKA